MGANQDVRPGDRYMVRQGGTDIAVIKIRDVNDNRATGEFEKVAALAVEPGQGVHAAFYVAKILHQIPDRNNPTARARLKRALVLKAKATNVGTFVSISVGSKNGVQVGDEFHLTRVGLYVGKITIVRVSKDSAYGRVVDGWAGAPPGEGDEAITHQARRRQQG